MNKVYVEFFSLTDLLKDYTRIEDIKRLLTKLNNPTYNKECERHPMAKHGWFTTFNIDPVLKAIQSMIVILNKEQSVSDCYKQLQVEWSWAFNEISKSSIKKLNNSH